MSLWKYQRDGIDTQAWEEAHKLWGEQTCNQYTLVQACVSGTLLGRGGGMAEHGNKHDLGMGRDRLWEGGHVATASP